MERKRTSAKFIFSLILGISLFGACEYEFIQPEQVVIPEVVSFSEDIIPIFNNSCNFSGCHVAGFSFVDLSPGNAYEDLFRKDMIDLDNPTLSRLYTKLIESNGTHESRSTPTEQATILEWINKGAKNN
jgi:hypothetical protein